MATKFADYILETHELEQSAISLDVAGDVPHAIPAYRKVIIHLDIAAGLLADRESPDAVALLKHQQDILRRLAYISTRPTGTITPVEDHISTVQISVPNPNAGNAPVVLGPPNGSPAPTVGSRAKRAGSIAWTGTKAGGRAVKTGAVATGKAAQNTNEKHDITGKVGRGTKSGAVAVGGAMNRGFKNLRERTKKSA